MCFYSPLIEIIYSTGLDLWSLTLLEAIFDFHIVLSNSVGITLWDFLYQKDRIRLVVSTVVFICGSIEYESGELIQPKQNMNISTLPEHYSRRIGYAERTVLPEISEFLLFILKGKH